MFGFLSLVGGSLTMASIAVLPVLIGLSVDYAIQFQARFAEAVAGGLLAASGGGGGRRQGRPGDRDRRPGHGGRLRRPGAVADPDGARLRAAARARDRGRLRAGAHRGPLGPLAAEAVDASKPATPAPSGWSRRV